MKRVRRVPRATRGVNARARFFLTRCFHAMPAYKFFAVREKIQSRSASEKFASAKRAFGRRKVRAPRDARRAEALDNALKKALRSVAHVVCRQFETEVLVFRQREETPRIVRHRPRHVI